MKVKVDSERCQGHTLCAMKAPEIFRCTRAARLSLVRTACSGEPTRLYPPEFAGAAGNVAPGPDYDGVEGETWPDDFPDLAARVCIPVQVTISEHKLW